MKYPPPGSIIRAHRIAANVQLSGEIEEEFSINAANPQAITGEEWEQITPWGNFPNDKGLQRLTMTEGQAMVAAFNSLVEKAKNLFRGVPIYVGHPDVDPKRWPDDRRIGKIIGLKARADGLYGKPAWNDLGEKNKTEGYWMYPSAVWHFKKCPGGVIAPFQLVSVGMTNTPNIDGVQPWAKNAKGRIPLRRFCSDPLFHFYGWSENSSPTIKKQVGDHQEILDGFSAGRAIAQKQSELIAQGENEHMALLKAKAALPESAALHEKHVTNLAAIREAEQQRKAREAFTAKVHARMDREKISYHDAWMKEKKQQEQAQQPN